MSDVLGGNRMSLPRLITGASIKSGYQTFVSAGGEQFGAVRDVYPHGLVLYVENAGEFRVPLDAVEAVHSEKVILDCTKLDRRLRRAIGHAHDVGVYSTRLVPIEEESMVDDNEVEATVILPVQLTDMQFRGSELQAEKRLQVAVLADAVATLARAASDTTPRGRELFAEVDEWFASDVAAGPFSFMAICDSLGMEPAYVRRGLRQLQTQDGAPAARKLSLRHESGSRHQIVRRVRRAA